MEGKNGCVACGGGFSYRYVIITVISKYIAPRYLTMNVLAHSLPTRRTIIMTLLGIALSVPPGSACATLLLNLDTLFPKSHFIMKSQETAPI